MWNRQEVKARGKASFKRNYGNCFLVALIHTLLAGSTAALSSRRASTAANTDYSGSINIDATDEQTMAIATAIIIAIIAAVAVVMIVMVALDIFVFNTLEIGCNRFFLLNNHADPSLNELTFSFKNNYLNCVLGELLRGFLIAIGFIIIVPGIILSYSYRMVPYILGTDPTIRPVDALKKSRAMMKGNKWNAFVFDLSFIGWGLLSVITCGIFGIAYLNPYKMSADAALFEAISATSQNN